MSDDLTPEQLAADNRQLRDELAHWRSGRRFRGTRPPTAAPDGLGLAARLARAQYDDDETHDRLLNAASHILKTLHDAAARMEEELQHLNEGAAWRVQWYALRFGPDGPEQAQGRHDFDTEAEARAYLASDEVQSRISDLWRVELQRQSPWITVEAGSYAKESRG